MQKNADLAALIRNRVNATPAIPCVSQRDLGDADSDLPSPPQ